MNSLRNSVRLMGNLGMDPDVRSFENGKVLARLSLATTETYKNAEGQRVNDTQWHNLIAWGPTAKIAEKYLRKGSEIAIHGKLVHRNYEDSDGVRKYVTEVVINDLLMINSRNSQD